MPSKRLFKHSGQENPDISCRRKGEMMHPTIKVSSILVFITILFTFAPAFCQVELQQHVISEDFGQGISIFPVDLDDDGDIDLVGAARRNNEITWWENVGQHEFDPHRITNAFRGAEDVYPIDLDQDGDMDILGVAINSNEVAWWENDSDQDFELHVISDDIASAACVAAADLDDDGDIDVVTGSEPGLHWWENDGDQDFRMHVVGGDFARMFDLYLEDMDDDDDIDILCASYSGNSVYWVENLGEGEFRSHLISDQVNGALAVHAVDLDNDEDMDVIAGAYTGDMLCWFENNGDMEFEIHVLRQNIQHVWDVFAVDIDHDGDVDILNSAYGDNMVCWCENLGDNEFDWHLISDDINGATGVYAMDMDRDSDIDVVGVFYGAGSVILWENLSQVFEMTVEPDSISFGPVEIETDRAANIQVIHTSENENIENISVVIQVTEGEDWLDVEPQEALINRNDTLDVEVTVFVREGEELGAHEGLISIRPNDLPGRTVDVPVSIFAVEGFGTLSGVVTDASNQQVMPDVIVTLEGVNLEAETNEEGFYMFDRLPAWTYCVMIDIEDYLPYRSDDFEVEPGQDAELNIGLLHALCETNIDSVCLRLTPDTTVVTEISIINEGNGSLRYTVERRFPIIGDADAWDLRTSINAAEQCGDDRLQGVEFAEGNFYATGGNNGDGRGLVHVFSREGEYVRSFDQFTDSQWGIRDLAWDGELLWGADDETIYGFTTDGELREQFNGPLDVNRAMTWDEEQGRLWICDITTDIFGIDRSGNLMDIIDISSDIHIYGLGTFPEDSSGFTLYTFNKDGEYESQINRINPETNEIELVADQETISELKAGGACITASWDPMSWVFVGVLQGREGVLDELAVWHMDSNRIWLMSEPDSSTVDAGGSTVVEVTISSEGYLQGVELSGELVITHNGRGSQVIIPVILQVVHETGIDVKLDGFEYPSTCILTEPYPNPFNSSTVIAFSVQTRQYVDLSAWDIQGRKVADIAEGIYNAGSHRIMWGRIGLSTGTYVIRLETGCSILCCKAVFIK